MTSLINVIRLDHSQAFSDIMNLLEIFLLRQLSSHTECGLRCLWSLKIILFCFIHQYLETYHVCYKHCFELNFRLQNISSSVIFKAALQKRWIKTFNINEENRYLWYHMFIEISYKQKKNGRSRIHNCSTILQLVFNIKYHIQQENAYF